MRLIDADALMKEFAKFVRASNNSDFAPIPTWNDAVSLVGSAPTATQSNDSNALNVLERKKGKWVDRGYMKVGFHCSVCGGYAISGKDNFCSHCGADMRGERRSE